MAANNETGAIQPVAEAAEIVHAAGGLLHSDAVQVAGRLPLKFGALGADMMTLSAHKIGGPKGVGALVLRQGAAVEPLIKGGGQERRRRAGTENVAGIVGFGVAAELAAAEAKRAAELAALRDELEAKALATRAGGCGAGGQGRALAQYELHRGSGHQGRDAWSSGSILRASR